MEEMREAAMAYYANMSKDQQKTLVSFYKSIDANGVGEVSIQEYLDFLVKKGHNLGLHTNPFKLLDKNNDGTLDFEESVTFFYMLTSNRLVICAGCQSYLWGLHFRCIECHKVDKEMTYDLCCSCYHSCFMDNYALLRYTRSMDKLIRCTKKVLKFGGKFAWRFFIGGRL